MITKQEIEQLSLEMVKRMIDKTNADDGLLEMESVLREAIVRLFAWGYVMSNLGEPAEPAERLAGNLAGLLIAANNMIMKGMDKEAEEAKRNAQT